MRLIHLRPWQELDCARCDAIVDAYVHCNGPHLELSCKECGGYLGFTKRTPDVLAQIVPRPEPPQTSFDFGPPTRPSARRADP